MFTGTPDEIEALDKLVKLLRTHTEHPITLMGIQTVPVEPNVMKEFLDVFDWYRAQVDWGGL